MLIGPAPELFTAIVVSSVLIRAFIICTVDAAVVVAIGGPNVPTACVTRALRVGAVSVCAASAVGAMAVCAAVMVAAPRSRPAETVEAVTGEAAGRGGWAARAARFGVPAAPG